jgi:hypothetical protein
MAERWTRELAGVGGSLFWGVRALIVAHLLTSVEPRR